MSSELFECINVWLTNGACNRENNNEECGYDGGDCCRKSCVENCAAKAADASQENCQFVCGTFNGFECKEPTVKTHLCSTDHGEDLEMGNCLKDLERIDNDNPDQFTPNWRVVFQMLRACQAVNWSMGNTQTINLYCG